MIDLFYITNNPEIAKIAQKYGVNRIWVDLETLGKEERQKGLNAVKSHHTVSDIRALRPILNTSELMVRVNPWNMDSEEEIDEVIEAGADSIILPMWKTGYEVQRFLKAVNGRCKTNLLLETKEAVSCIDEVLNFSFDEIHIGLNDLHLSYGMNFMFEPVANGIVEQLCGKFRKKGIPYGFGGIAKIGDGLIPAEMLLVEHYRVGSTRAILSRTFCDNAITNDIDEIERIFSENVEKIRDCEKEIRKKTPEEMEENRKEIVKRCGVIVQTIRERRNNVR